MMLCFCCSFCETGEDVVAHVEGVFLQVFFFDDFEDGFAHRANDGVAAEGVEVNSLCEHFGDLRRRDDCGERAAVADAFGHGDDVRDDALGFEAPEMRAGAAEASLDFVGNGDAACGADVFVSVLEVAVREDDATADALDGFGDEAGDVARGGEVDDALDVRGVFFAGVRIVAAVRSAIGIGSDGVMDAEGVREIKFPGAMRREGHGGHVAAVVAIAQRDHVVVASVKLAPS